MVEGEQVSSKQGNLAILHLHLHPIPTWDGLREEYKSSFHLLAQTSIWLLPGQVPLVHIILG